ncbi:hypothetical protein PsorP6_011964 [Peronosclerospora sorghi]|uniref:Uncharacterized protein n=1 Tax=Peronosclerospora sorghi TaxID=230839 RepID=A0ACC0WI67_9STRA|nr:hypothetical protein PsorP6_011964 [Peronosclerospora sorghi]
MVAYADALIFILHKGLFVIDSPEAFPEPYNIVSSAPLPSVMSHSLIKIRTAVLSELHGQYTQRLQRTGWTQAQINQVKQDHRDLLSAYRGEPVFKMITVRTRTRVSTTAERCAKAGSTITRVFSRSGYHVPKHRKRVGIFLPDWIRERRVPQLADRLLIGRYTA